MSGVAPPSWLWRQPPAASGEAGPGQGEVSRRQAWQREMERAQLATWFHEPVLQERPGPAAAGEAAPRAARPSSLAAPAASVAAVSGRTGSATAAPVQGPARVERWSEPVVAPGVVVALAQSVADASRAEPFLQEAARSPRPMTASAQALRGGLSDLELPASGSLPGMPVQVAAGLPAAAPAQLAAAPAGGSPAGQAVPAQWPASAGAAAGGPLPGHSAAASAGAMAAAQAALPRGLALPLGGALSAAPSSPLEAALRAVEQTIEQALEDAVAHARGHSPRPAAAEAQPVRWHVEPSVQGVAVWLGIDGSPEQVAQRLVPLLRELQRSLSETGQRLGTVVCNGRTVLDAARPAATAFPFPPDTHTDKKEGPWPSRP